MAMGGLSLPSSAFWRRSSLVERRSGEERHRQLVKTTIEKSSSQFVQPEDRVATFDQDGTLWVEHPI